MRTILLAAAALAALAAPAAAQTASQPAPTAAAVQETYILAGALLDRPGQAPRGASTVIVRGGKIAEVRDGFAAAPAGAKTIDLRDRFVMPGLIDMHVHLVGIDGDVQQMRLTTATQDEADDMVLAVTNMRDVLAAGFTTVRDLGATPRSIRALRQGVERGDLVGPTIVNAGMMISVTGGHSDYTNGLRQVFAEGYHQHQINTCDGPDGCRKAVREQVALGAQVIKFAATGGVMSNVSGGLGRAMTPEEMAAIVDTAHGLGRRVAAHSHALEGTKAALEAGADTIEHASFLDDATIKLFKAKGAYMVPTMLANETLLKMADRGELGAATVPKLREAAGAALTAHRRAIAAGVKIAFGTDSGVSKFGENAREFTLLVNAGMTPAQALASATVNAATALGREKTIGTIEPGKDADIIAIRGNPLENIERMGHVSFVMRQGKVTPAMED